MTAGGSPRLKSHVRTAVLGDTTLRSSMAETSLGALPAGGKKGDMVMWSITFFFFVNFFIYTETTSDNLVFIVAPVQ